MPDHVCCVAHTHADLIGRSWCGRDVRQEWHFVGADHAAENGRQNGRLVACPRCVEAIVDALRNG